MRSPQYPPGKSPHVKKETSIPFAGVMLAVLLFFSNLLTVGAPGSARCSRPPLDAGAIVGAAGSIMRP